MKLRALVVLVAACGGPKGPIGNQGGAGSPEWLERSTAFAPAQQKEALAKYRVPIDKTAALIKALPVDEERPLESRDDPERQRAYDLDGDGQVDLVTFHQVMFGPSDGWVVFTRSGTALASKPAFAMSGDWADARETAGAIAIRFEANILAPGEARYAQTLRYDKKTRAFGPVLETYAATQGKVATATAAFTAFETIGAATLRATPVVDDAPPKEDDGSGEGPTTTLRGNVLATYEAKARGVIVASEGDWRYVAFDPVQKPKETSLQHGMNHGPLPEDGSEAPANQLRTNTWLVGWVKAAELR